MTKKHNVLGEAAKGGAISAAAAVLTGAPVAKAAVAGAAASAAVDLVLGDASLEDVFDEVGDVVSGLTGGIFDW